MEDARITSDSFFGKSLRIWAELLNLLLPCTATVFVLLLRIKTTEIRPARGSTSSLNRRLSFFYRMLELVSTYLQFEPGCYRIQSNRSVIGSQERPGASCG